MLSNYGYSWRQDITNDEYLWRRDITNDGYWSGQPALLSDEGLDRLLALRGHPFSSLGHFMRNIAYCVKNMIRLTELFGFGRTSSPHPETRQETKKHEISTAARRSHVFTGHKRSLGQGNVFTGVCLSIGGGWLPSMHHRSHDQGVCIGGWWVDPRRTGKAGRTHSSDFYMIFEGGKKDMARPHPISHRLLSSFV